MCMDRHFTHIYLMGVHSMHKAINNRAQCWYLHTDWNTVKNTATGEVLVTPAEGEGIIRKLQITLSITSIWVIMDCLKEEQQ